MRRIRKIKPGNIPTPAQNNGITRIERGVRTSKVGKTNVAPASLPKNPTKIDWSNRPSAANWPYDSVKPLWLGETVYIIGGGPSLKGFEWSSLLGKRTIAINRAVQFWPQADACYWTDSRVYQWYKKDIDKFQGLKFTIRSGVPYEGTVYILKKGQKFGLESARDTLAHGNNSGYAAINLAVHLGAARIVLLGYDMGNDGKVSHFHEGYPTNATAEGIYKNEFIPGFTVLRELLYTKGIECYNASINSKLDVFPKVDLIRALSFR